jgi:hypothetical protein
MEVMEMSGWIANPYLPIVAGCLLALLAAALGLGWFRLRRQVRRLESELASERERTQGLELMPKQIEEVQEKLELLDRRTIPPGGWEPQSESVHLNRRGQVLKLHRGGHSVCEIASNLGLAEGEVRLTLKLHGLLRGQGGRKTEEFSLIPERKGDRNPRALLVRGAGV